ncbi:MAG: riboflavin biosynthesis protein RibF [Oscillospiraceae bacterium]
MEQGKRVIALGFFDGVHIGHGALLRRVADRAGELGAVPAAVTFDAHPDEVILKQETALLTTPAERADLMRRLYGVREIIVARFDAHLMHMDWREFVTDFLVAEHGAVHLVAGHDFHFGYRGEGNPERLRQLCAQLGIGCDIIPPVALDGITVSSTYIRTLIAQGETERAMEFLGHPHTLTDRVRHGKKLGSRLGFPTMNLQIPSGCVVPAFGVYAARVWADGEVFSAAANVGIRPTVNDGQAVTVEATLLDFAGDLYGKTVRMEFYRHLRPEQKFESLEALRTQVLHDIETIRNYFKRTDK